MKILVLSKDLNYDVTGGQKINKRIFDILAKSGHEVTFCQKLHPTQGNWQYLFSLIVHVVEYQKYDKIVIDSSSFVKTLWFVLIMRMLGGRKRIIITLHHYIYEGIKGIKGWLYKLLETSFVKQCDMAIIFSPYIMDLSRKYILPSRIKYVGLPFKKDIAYSGNNVFGRLLYVGTIEERKGLKYLITALSLLPFEVRDRIKLNVVGKIVSKYYYKDLCSLIKQTGLEKNVFFKGRVTDEELQLLYDNSMIFTFPSLLEGFGMVIIEAMAKGLPVIAFDNSAIPYTVITNKNGILAKNKDAQSFSNAILEILSDEDFYKRLVKGARKTYENAMSYEEFDKELEKLFA